jgi:hypothetical protein
MAGNPEPGFLPKASLAESGEVDVAVGFGHSTSARGVSTPMAVGSGHASFALTDRIQASADGHWGLDAQHPDQAVAALGAMGVRMNVIQSEGLRLAPFVVGGRSATWVWEGEYRTQDLYTLVLPGLAAEIGPEWLTFDASVPIPLSLLYQDQATLMSYRYDRSKWEIAAWELASVADFGVTARFLGTHSVRLGVTSPLTPTLSWRVQPGAVYLEGHAFAGTLGAGFQGRVGVAL